QGEQRVYVDNRAHQIQHLIELSSRYVDRRSGIQLDRAAVPHGNGVRGLCVNQESAADFQGSVVVQHSGDYVSGRVQNINAAATAAAIEISRGRSGAGGPKGI